MQIQQNSTDVNRHTCLSINRFWRRLCLSVLLGLSVAGFWLIAPQADKSDLLFIAQADSELINVYDANQLWLLSQIKTGIQPEQLYIHPFRKMLLAVSITDRQAVQIDLNTLRVEQQLSIPAASQWLCLSAQQPVFYAADGAGLPLFISRSQPHADLSKAATSTLLPHCASQLISDTAFDPESHWADSGMDRHLSDQLYVAGITTPYKLTEQGDRSGAGAFEFLGMGTAVTWVNLTEPTNYQTSADRDWAYIASRMEKKLVILHAQDPDKNRELTLDFIPQSIALDK